MRSQARHRLSGQTLIVGIIVLGVLLILGFAFAGIISRNLFTETRSRERGVASDLAEAGVRYAHAQLLNSELGADWRPQLTPASDFIDPQGFSKDPDALYMRPGTGFPFRAPNDVVIDRGGPDGLGPFTRIEFDRGRALVRIRYAPSDLSDGGGSGSLRQPGRARSYLMLEAVGRPNRVNPRDPSNLLSEAIQITNFGGNDGLFRSEFARLRRVDSRIVNSRRLMAFASIGIIETARFITNKHSVNKAAEIGSITPPRPNDAGPGQESLGVRYEGVDVSVPTAWGGEFLPNDTRQGTGSLYSNADLLVHGRHDVLLDPRIGDGWMVAGSIRGANDGAELRVTDTQSGNTYLLGNNTADSFDSRKNSYSSLGGLVRDGSQAVDKSGYSRAIGRKEPPSIDRVDPATNVNRYIQMTRNSGVQLGRFNTGRFGWGRGVYVDSAERGNLPGEAERSNVEVGRALVNDWLNPDNSASQGWRGGFYVPIAAYLRLLPDGFEIVRDSRSRQRTWRYVDATNPSNPRQVNTQNSRARFRIRRLADGRVFILNGFVARDGTTLPRLLIERPAAGLSDGDFVTYGQEFNGVVAFEGDVRVRGVIPTNLQLSVVSFGTIYIEGSITKGVVSERGEVIANPSTSALMLMARDHVAINTTMFFGPANGEEPDTKFAYRDAERANPIEVGLDEGRIARPILTLQTQFLLNPADATGRPNPNPQTWLPYALQYQASGTGGAIAPALLLSHSADNDGPSFINLDTAAFTYNDNNPGSRFFNPYLFPRLIDFGAAGQVVFNGAATSFSGTANIPILGLGALPASRWPSLETFAFPIVRPTNFTYGNRKLGAAGGNPEGQYVLGVQDESLIQIRMTNAGNFAPKNYLLERAAVTPFDVRIEAAMFAEEGSFFVIPGKSFNMNSSDTREAFDALVADLRRQGAPDPVRGAQRLRFERTGNSPDVPFFNEPLDVRVSILGAVSENLPPSVSQQAEWQKKWGWIPRYLGASGVLIPSVHVPPGYDVQNRDRYVPNLIVTYDPALATGTVNGQPVRVSAEGWTLPPMPRLPVSPTLSYFGEVNP